MLPERVDKRVVIPALARKPARVGPPRTLVTRAQLQKATEDANQAARIDADRGGDISRALPNIASDVQFRRANQWERKIKSIERKEAEA